MIAETGASTYDSKTSGLKDCPSTSAFKMLGMKPCSISRWRRLREVCTALQQTQERVSQQRNEIDGLLQSQTKYRDAVAAVQMEAVELRYLRAQVEHAKCHLMTLRMKLIRVFDEKTAHEEDTKERRKEVTRIERDLERRIEALSLRRESAAHAASLLVLRRRKMLKDLMNIYKIDSEGRPECRLAPTPCMCRPAITIAGLHLPDTKTLLGHPEFEVTAAVGHVVHVLSLMSKILNVPLRFPVSFQGSRSTIMNPVTTEIFALYSMSKNRDMFEEAMNYLNNNIVQLRSDCGLGTRNQTKTLDNLHDLLLRLTVKDSEPKFVRPSRSVFSPSSVMRSAVSEDTLIERALRETENGRKSVDASNVQLVRSLSRRASVGSLQGSTLLFDSSTIAALSLTSHSSNGNAPKTIPSSTMNIFEPIEP